MKLVQRVCVVGLALALPACATAIRGTQEAMVIDTDPAGARITTSIETKASKKARKKNQTLRRFIMAALQPRANLIYRAKQIFF